MSVPVRIDFTHNLRIDVLLQHRGMVKPAADEHRRRLLKGYSPVSELRCERGLRHLVTVPSGELSEYCEILPVLLREEAYREELIAPQELIGVAGQMDVDGDNGLCLSCVSPDGAEAAPGNGAGVELLRRARGRRRPPLLNMSVSIHAPSREAASDNAGTSAEIKSRILPDRPCYDRKNILLFTGEGAERQFHALMIT